LIETADGMVYGGWARCYFRSGGCEGGLTTIDLSDAALQTYEYQSVGVTDLAAVGDYLYVLGSHFTIRPLNALATTPDLNPELPPIDGRVIGLKGHTLYNINAHLLQSYNVTNPLAPVQLMSTEAAPEGTFFLETSLHHNHVYLVSHYGFHVFNVADSENMFGIGYVALQN
jgi:hypothetical protein